MRTAKGILTILFLAIVLLSTTTNTVADSHPPATENHIQDNEDIINMLASGQMFWENLTKQEKNNLLKFMGINIKESDIKSVRIVKIPQRSQHLVRNVHGGNRSPQYMWVSVTGSTEFCKIPYVAATSGPGPGTLTLEQSYSTSTGWSTNVGISAEIVSAGVGFQVSHTKSGSAIYSINLRSGEYGAIYAYPWMRQVNFDIWDDPWWGPPYRAGSGWARDLIGTCYAVVRW